MRWIVAIFFVPILGLAQDQFAPASGNKVSAYFTAFSQAEGINSVSTENIQGFIKKLESRRSSFRNDRNFLHYVFTKTHQKFLKNYREYATFTQLTSSGTYNCLTGTALYALILEQLSFKYQIIETNYHIFLLTDSQGGKILFEATDPLKGFASSQSEIEKRIESYKKNTFTQTAGDKIYYRFNTSLYNTITMDGILGLMHYNLAIEAYNTQDLPACVSHLDKAIKLYQSPRIEEFSKIIHLTILESKLELSVKESCLKKIQSIRRQKMPVVASTKTY
jgi:hypothetical protein